MATSQNGYPANNRSLIHNPTVPGTNITFPGGIRKGAVTTVLLYVAVQWQRRIEPLTPGHNWGYAERSIRGSSQTSNHASGTATDHNAPKHPLAKKGTFTAAQRATLQAIAREVDNVVRFGEFYSGRVDGMHAEINAPLASVERTAARLLAGGAPVTSSPTPAGGSTALLRRGSKGDAVKQVQQRLKVAYRAYAGHLAVDGDFGPATEAAVKEFQRRSNLAADGIVGPVTRRTLGL